jgi:hypothetical protein
METVISSCAEAAGEEMSKAAVESVTRYISRFKGPPYLGCFRLRPMKGACTFPGRELPTTEAKRGDPYSRKTPKKGRSSQAVANDEPTTAKEHNAPCLRAFLSRILKTLAPKEQANTSIVRR